MARRCFFGVSGNRQNGRAIKQGVHFGRSFFLLSQVSARTREPPAIRQRTQDAKYPGNNDIRGNQAVRAVFLFYRTIASVAEIRFQFLPR